MNDLAGRTVLLTGASGEIGAATARELGVAGAHVIAHCRDDVAGARRAVAAIPPERRLVLRAELGERGAAADLWRRALAWRGRIDVLVANAATLIAAPLDASDGAWRRAWTRTLSVNVRASADLMREAVRHLGDGGVIITIASTAGQRGAGDPDLAAYAASKAALAAATQTIARARTAHGLLAYVVAPGAVHTAQTERAAAGAAASQLAAAALPLGEWAPPSELAALVAELAGGRWPHLSGATLDVNGAAYVR